MCELVGEHATVISAKGQVNREKAILVLNSVIDVWRLNHGEKIPVFLAGLRIG
jgi:hypothetical protein